MNPGTRRSRPDVLSQNIYKLGIILVLNGWHIGLGTTTESEHLAFLYMHVYTNGAAEGRCAPRLPLPTYATYMHSWHVPSM